uniref:SFRICE_030563 n=1 Tax=Spodoptera frugiperda TaxID=7108 RepID=A0A2H1WRS8_SPOFR
MKDNDLLGANKKPVIYLDETWIHAHYTVKKCWQKPTDVGVRRNDSPGRRWIIVHAGSEAAKIREEPEFLNKILWADESTFKRDGYLNLHNMNDTSKIRI